jgi:ribose 5-phosphate isomerase B
MKIAVASDHRGVPYKTRVIEQLNAMGHTTFDLGTNSYESVDYPDYASKVSLGVSKNEYDRGILICGTGIGMCITANKFNKVRAAPVHDEVTVELGRRHNDANVICLSGDLIGEELLSRIVDLFVNTPFEEGRHARRLDKIKEIEKGDHGQ